MIDALTPVITDAGITALFNAQNTGVEAAISHIAVGDAGWVPGVDAAALQNERQRVAVAGGDLVEWNRIHVTALIDGPDEFWIREIGFYLDDGTLFAVWSCGPDCLHAWKAADVPFLIAEDLILQGIPPDCITVTAPVENLNLHYAGPLAAVSAAAIDNMNRIIMLARGKECAPPITRNPCA